MISVDVYVPCLNMTYDFSLNENVRIETVIEEMTAAISAKEHWAIGPTAQDLEMYDIKHERKMDRFSTLYAEGIGSGQKLLLC